MIRPVESDDEALRCYPVMRQLRPHLETEQVFLERWKRQARSGYRLLAAWQEDAPVALAGYRETENLVHGHHLYVDDLVTDSGTRSGGHGAALIAFLKKECVRRGCDKLVLDSGMSNALAHRFYFRQGFLAMGLHFTLPVTA